MDEQEFINRFGMTRDEYGQRYGTLQDPNQGKGATLREKTVDATANFLQGLGSDQYTAYKRARDLFGNPNADLSESIGVLDLTPVQLPFAIQEGKRALQRGDTAEGLFDLGFAGVEMFPAAKLATTPIKGFAKSLASKLSKSTDNFGALPTDPSRRNFLTKAGTTAVAAPLGIGALSEVPVGKIIDDVLPTTKIVEDAVIEPKKVGSSLFKNIKQEAKFAAEMYNAKTGKNLTPEEIIEKDMAEYLYFHEEGSYGLEQAAKKIKSNPVYEVLDDVGYEADNPKIMKVFKKYMGDADEYSYGSSSGDELAHKLFKEENPDKLNKTEGLEYEDADMVDWIKSKGIQNTKYYKQLVKAGDAG